MNPSNPKITVLMPVYNGEKYLREAVDSILTQTFADFEFLIINDGSTDGSVKIIESYADPRIRLIHNKKNLGLISSLNRGFDLATGQYIVRMDCDDISLPDRLAEQFDFMERRPEVAYCGSWTKIIGGKKIFVNTYPAADDELRTRLLFNTPFAHPSVIIRRQVIIQNGLKHDENYSHAEDYEFWSRAVSFGQMANIEKVLLFHRRHERSISSTYTETQKANADKVRSSLLEKLGLAPGEKELAIHSAFVPPPGFKDEEFFEQLEDWFKKILTANARLKIYEQPVLTKIISDRWLKVLSANARLGFRVWRKFWRSELSQEIKKGDRLAVAKFFVKCIIA